MPSIANVFQAETTRLARKVVREECAPLKSAASAHRAEVAGLKRQIQALQIAVMFNRRIAGLRSKTSR